MLYLVIDFVATPPCVVVRTADNSEDARRAAEGIAQQYANQNRDSLVMMYECDEVAVEQFSRLIEGGEAAERITWADYREVRPRPSVVDIFGPSEETDREQQ